MRQRPDRHTYLTQTPIPRLIWSLAVPTIISMLVTGIYNSADTYFVGRISTQATAALVGADVRLLFPPAVGVVPDAPFSTNSLPLPLDGSTTRLLRTDGTGHVIPLMARCTPVSAPGGMYLLVARSDASTVAADREHERRMDQAREDSRKATCNYVSRVTADYKRGKKWKRKDYGDGKTD